MQVIAAGEAKTHFGHLIDMSQREPVTIEKRGRPVSVVLSIEDFERYQEAEDQLWALEAKKAEKGGYLSAKESAEFLDSL